MQTSFKKLRGLIKVLIYLSLHIFQYKISHRRPILIPRAVILVFNCYHCMETWPGINLIRVWTVVTSMLGQKPVGRKSAWSGFRGEDRWGKYRQGYGNSASREESSPIFWRNNILSLLSIHSFINSRESNLLIKISNILFWVNIYYHW